MKLDSFNNTKIVAALTPRRVSDDTAQVGSIVDLAGFHSALIAIAAGTLAAAAAFPVLLEHGDDAALADAAAVPDADLLGTEAGASFTEADDNETRKLGYIGVKRHIRLTVTPSGNAAAADMSPLAVLGGPRVGPETDQAAGCDRAG